MKPLGIKKLYYSISEVAELVSVKPHVLRYWETQFKMLRPRKNRAGNRSYRVKDAPVVNPEARKAKKSNEAATAGAASSPRPTSAFSRPTAPRASSWPT